MTMAAIERLAEALLAARRQRSTCDASGFEDALETPADAFLVQDLVTRGISGQQGFPRYWKTGAAGRDFAPHAALPSEGVWPSPADASHWYFNLCLVEAEVAFRLARDVNPERAASLARDDVAPLVDATAVTIELVDSRWQQGLSAPALLKLADLQSHGALVVGEWTPFAERDWLAQSGTVRIGERAPVAWRGTHAAGDPLSLLPGWLRHATRGGQTVPAGTVVTTGTWCGMLPAGAGDRVIASFEGVGEAVVQL